MALTYTGKLFRRIAICCGAAHGNPHKVWEMNFRFKYRNEYDSRELFLYRRSETDNRWKLVIDGYEDNKLFEYWKALKWLEDNGFICKKKELFYRGCYGSGSYMTDCITLTEKGLAIAPKYLKQEEG